MSDPQHIHHWRRVDARLTTSGQPTESQLFELRDLGVRRIINLGLHSHERALPDERASVEALGMSYIHIPVDFAKPTEVDFARFCDAMAGAADTVLHVHCIANLRVSAFLYRYWRDVEGIEEAKARALMDTLWQPGGVWAAIIGDTSRIHAPHEPPPK